MSFFNKIKNAIQKVDDWAEKIENSHKEHKSYPKRIADLKSSEIIVVPQGEKPKTYKVILAKILLVLFGKNKLVNIIFKYIGIAIISYIAFLAFYYLFSFLSYLALNIIVYFLV